MKRWGFVLMVGLSACSEPTAGPLPGAVPALVQKVAPAGWAVAEDAIGEVPAGHYWGSWGAGYKGPRGRRIVFAGPRDTAFRWRDESGGWHEQNLFKEALALWIMPGDYRESWASRLNPLAPVPPELLFSGTSVKVYAAPSAHLTSPAQFKAVLKDAVETASRNAEQGLSWSTWRADLQREFASSGGSGGAVH